MSDMKKGALGKLRLCDSIRRGCKIHWLKADGVLRGAFSSCVQGAALVGIGHHTNNVGNLLWDVFKTNWPFIVKEVNCPACSMKCKDILYAMRHLNNYKKNGGGHNWSRLRIANWIERAFESEIPQGATLVTNVKEEELIHV